MAEYKVLAKKRSTRQIFMAGVFLIILIGGWFYPLLVMTCPIQVAPFKFKKTGLEIVTDWDCLKCKLCVLACPKGALSLVGGKT